MIKLVIPVAVFLAGCSDGGRDSATLYRNSPLDPSMRVHFSSFDAPERTPYNINNCQMTARLLNANVAANASAENREMDERIGFWCEPGDYREKGATPFRFDSEFPTDSFGH